MRALFAALTAFALTVLLIGGYRRIAERTGWLKPNVVGRRIPVGTGVVLPFAWLFSLPFGLTPAVTFDGLHDISIDASFAAPTRLAASFEALALTAAFIGWLDDAFGETAIKGIGGHIRRLFTTGKPTTGVMKLLLYPPLGALAAARVGASPVFGALAFAALAHGLNLLDTRPLRALKGFFILYAIVFTPTLAAAPIAERPPLPVLAGSLIALCGDDRRMRGMIGEAGVAVLALVLLERLWAAPPEIGFSVVFGLAALAALSERRSLSDVIVRSRVLSAVDRLGLERPLAQDEGRTVRRPNA
ncbi:MAG: hypothetical protein IMW86_05670 [Hydrogenibacillus sp.]|nr:hypothetical protein [Hydrogenibacillus sp.]